MIKTRAKANLIRGLGSNEGLAFALGLYQARYDDWRELFRSVDRIEKVTQGGYPARRESDVCAGQPHGGDHRVCRRPLQALACAARRWAMKRALLLLFGFFVLVVARPQVAALRPKPTNWKQIPIPKLPAFHPPQPKRIQLPNGMVIFLQEDHELPLIDGVARIRGGARSVPAGKTGLHRHLRRSLAHRWHQDADRRSTRRLSGTARRQGRNRRRRRLDHHQSGRA